MRVLASMRPARVHLTTDSNAAEAGDGPLPVAGGQAGHRQPFPARARLSV